MSSFFSDPSLLLSHRSSECVCPLASSAELSLSPKAAELLSSSGRQFKTYRLSSFSSFLLRARQTLVSRRFRKEGSLLWPQSHQSFSGQAQWESLVWGLLEVFEGVLERGRLGFVWGKTCERGGGSWRTRCSYVVCPNCGQILLPLRWCGNCGDQDGWRPS